MEHFFEALQEKIKEEPIKSAAFVYIEFVKMHPFSEANGRPTRALMNTVLHQADYKPVVFLQNKIYMQTVNRAQRKIMEYLKNF